jgi:hypothetical protein
VIWIETLSRHKEPVHRLRCPDETVTVGRAYDNDAIVDDPYVAPHHLRIRRDDDGTLIAEDLGTQNGLYDEKCRRCQMLRLSGNTQFRIGQTWLRVRESAFAVAPERKLSPSKRLWPWLVTLLIPTIGLQVLFTWFQDSWERQDAISMYLGPLLMFSLLTALWIGFWAFMARIFLGHVYVIIHSIIALSGLATAFVALFLQNWLSFAFSSSSIAYYGFVFYWALLAAICIAHLRAIRVRLFLRKALVVSALAFCAGLTQWLADQPFSSDESSDDDYLKQMFPPSWRLAAPKTEEEFIGEIHELKARLDTLRARNLDEKTAAADE